MHELDEFVAVAIEALIESGPGRELQFVARVGREPAIELVVVFTVEDVEELIEAVYVRRAAFVSRGSYIDLEVSHHEPQITGGHSRVIRVGGLASPLGLTGRRGEEAVVVVALGAESEGRALLREIFDLERQ